MAYSVDSRANTDIADLRDGLAAVERGLVNVTPDSVEALLRQLDAIEALFESLVDRDTDLRPEEGRWEGILMRLSRRPQVIASAAHRADGYRNLRERNQPAESFWWHLDAEAAKIRAAQFRRLGLSLAVIALIIGAVYVGVTYVFPPDPATILVVETQTMVETSIVEQDWEGALVAVRSARETIPDELELIIWEAVLLEQLGEVEEAEALLAGIDFGSEPALVWVVVGNNRLQVADYDGAEEAANRALAFDDTSPQATFLLANVADLRGERELAIDLFDQTFTLAEKDNPQLAVIAKVRLGELLQQIDPFSASTADDSADTVTE